jgi:hypothetical protein
VVAIRIPPVASMTRKQEPNWRVKRMRRAITGSRRVNFQVTSASRHVAEIAAKGRDERRGQPILSLTAIEHHLRCAKSCPTRAKPI